MLFFFSFLQDAILFSSKVRNGRAMVADKKALKSQQKVLFFVTSNGFSVNILKLKPVYNHNKIKESHTKKIF
jgi:hypothetical protein